MQISEKKVRRIVLILGMIVCAVIQYTIIRVPNGGIIKVVSDNWNTEFNLRGILQSVMALACLFLVCVDYKKGMIFTYVMLGFSSVSLSVSILKLHNLGSLPGTVTLILTMVSAKIISSQLKLEESKSVTDIVTGL